MKSHCTYLLSPPSFILSFFYFFLSSLLSSVFFNFLVFTSPLPWCSSPCLFPASLSFLSSASCSFLSILLFFFHSLLFLSSFPSFLSVLSLFHYFCITLQSYLFFLSFSPLSASSFLSLILPFLLCPSFPLLFLSSLSSVCLSFFPFNLLSFLSSSLYFLSFLFSVFLLAVMSSVCGHTAPLCPSPCSSHFYSKSPPTSGQMPTCSSYY